MTKRALQLEANPRLRLTCPCSQTDGMQVCTYRSVAVNTSDVALYHSRKGAPVRRSQEETHGEGEQ
jgi:hypothetical protein